MSLTHNDTPNAATAPPAVVRVEPTTEDLWNLDHWLARVIAYALIRFKEGEPGHPANLSAEQWGAVLDEMIDGFQSYVDDESGGVSDESRAKAKRACELLGEWLPGLWW